MKIMDWVNGAISLTEKLVKARDTLMKHIGAEYYSVYVDKVECELAANEITILLSWANVAFKIKFDKGSVLELPYNRLKDACESAERAIVKWDKLTQNVECDDFNITFSEFSELSRLGMEMRHE